MMRSSGVPFGGGEAVSDNKLVLHPIDPWAILQDPPALLDSLRGVGLIAGAFSHIGELHYRAGARLLELLAFKGDPPGGPQAVHFALLETTEVPAFLGGSNAQPPACPGCQTPLADWRKQLIEWHAAPQKYAWTCAKCGRRAPVQALVWGDTGGIARFALDAWNVPPGEALPTPELMAHLERELVARWRHFYYRF